MGIDSEEGSGKPLDVLNAHPWTYEFTTEGEELFQKECTFERLAGAGIDFLIHDGVDCVLLHSPKNCYLKLNQVSWNSRNGCL